MLDAKSVFQVDGMVAVITGGGTGIGWMMAEALAINGASKIFLLGRREDTLIEAAGKYPNIMVPVTCDVTSKESLGLAVELVAKTTGYINLLVANSGIAGPCQKFGGATEMAGAILYLASQAGSFTNGNVLLCDGGRAGVIPATY